MFKLTLRKIKTSDKKYFARWWRDKLLISLTSGVSKLISDKEVRKYFLVMLDSKKAHHFMIIVGRKVIGHIALVKRKNNWYETQIVIGEKQYWNKGYGTKAIELLLRKAKFFGVSKIFLEVRLDNARAIKVYKKCGFRGIKSERKLLRMEFK